MAGAWAELRRRACVRHTHWGLGVYSSIISCPCAKRIGKQPSYSGSHLFLNSTYLLLRELRKRSPEALYGQRSNTFFGRATCLAAGQVLLYDASRRRCGGEPSGFIWAYWSRSSTAGPSHDIRQVYKVVAFLYVKEGGAPRAAARELYSWVGDHPLPAVRVR